MLQMHSFVTTYKQKCKMGFTLGHPVDSDSVTCFERHELSLFNVPGVCALCYSQGIEVCYHQPLKLHVWKVTHSTFTSIKISIFYLDKSWFCRRFTVRCSSNTKAISPAKWLVLSDELYIFCDNSAVMNETGFKNWQLLLRTLGSVYVYA